MSTAILVAAVVTNSGNAANAQSVNMTAGGWQYDKVNEHERWWDNITKSAHHKTIEVKRVPGL